MNDATFLKEKADLIRDEVVSISIANSAGHIAPSLSCVDILTALYYKVMTYDPKNPFWEKRDRLIFSKGHGCYALYAILADKGVIPLDRWHSFRRTSYPLPGCVERNLELGLEASCGSLGHGLPMAVGVALGAKLQGQGYHTFCVVGDGVLQEGTNWESIQFAVKNELSNLTIIIDRNRLQAMDFIVNILDREENDLLNRLKGFGLSPRVCSGHNAAKVAEVIGSLKSSRGDRPKVLVAKTIKGFGLKCMESVPKFHFRLPTEQEIQQGRSYG